MRERVRQVVSFVGRAVVFELRLYRSLFRWITRRPAVPRTGVEVFGYAQAVTPVMWLWIFASATELVVVHLLLPWETVRLVVDVLSLWGLVWMIGLLAGLRVHPHLMDPRSLRVRHGASVDITVPWEDVESVAVRRRDLPSTVWTLQPEADQSGTDLRVGVSGQVNVHVSLRRPRSVPTPKGELEISALSFLADDPRSFVTRARQLLDSQAANR